MEIERYKMIYKLKKVINKSRDLHERGANKKSRKLKKADINLRILGKEFVKCNKNKGRLIIKNKNFL